MLMKLGCFLKTPKFDGVTKTEAANIFTEMTKNTAKPEER